MVCRQAGGAGEEVCMGGHWCALRCAVGLQLVGSWWAVGGQLVRSGWAVGGRVGWVGGVENGVGWREMVFWPCGRS